MRSTRLIIDSWLSISLLLLLPAAVWTVDGAEEKNLQYNIDPVNDANLSMNITSERYRRLIPYMTFYLTQGFLPQVQQQLAPQYSQLAPLNNNLDGQIRYQQQQQQQQNTASSANVAHTHALQYPILNNPYTVRPSAVSLTQQPQQNYPQPILASPTSSVASSGLSRYSNYPQQPLPLPITQPSYYSPTKQLFPSLQYHFKPIAIGKLTPLQDQQRLNTPISVTPIPAVAAPQKQTYPKVIVQSYAPAKNVHYSQPISDNDRRQQYAKLLLNYNYQKQLQYSAKELKPLDNIPVYTKPAVQSYAVPQQYQSTDDVKQDGGQQPTVITESDYDQQQTQMGRQNDNSPPEDDTMTIVQSQELQAHAPQQQETTQEETVDPADQSPDSESERFEELLAGYQLSKTLPDRITSANIGSSIRTLSQILKLLQRASNLPGLNKSLLSQTQQHTEYDNEEKQNKLLQGYSPTQTEGSTPGRAGVDYPNYFEIPPTSFNCKDQRYKGFFGDPDTNCQVWHYCDLNGGQASFLCPNGTIFSQVALTCDWWFNVKCASTAQLYVLNERLYKYILPARPSFPEDYAGPLVDQYLALKYYETEAKKKNGTSKAATQTTTESPSQHSDYNPLQSLLTNEIKRKV